MTDSQNIPVRNAGTVLLSPFIPRLLERLNFTADNHFTHQQNREKAVQFLQYVITGKQIANSDLALNKIICGLTPEANLSENIEITTEDATFSDQVLNALISNWRALGSTSVEGLRENFLIREGLLSESPEQWKLTVERKSFDVLLNQCPFSFSLIKYPWMGKPLVVEWII